MLKDHSPPAPEPIKSARGDHGLRLGDVFIALREMLRRRFWTLLLVSLTLIILAFVAISMMHPKYDAVTRIRIDPSRNPMSQEQAQSALNSEAIETEVGLMTSREVALEVVKQLRLDADPEFAAGNRGKPVPPAERLNRVADRVLRNLSVSRDQLSYIITLGFRSRDPQKSALVANSFADTYMNARLSAQRGTSAGQADFFRGRLDQLARDANMAEARLADYRANAGISENGATGTVVDQQIAPLSTQLATAEAEAAAARSSASVAQSQVESGGLDSVGAVRASNVIGDLRSQRAQIVRSMGEVEARYGAKHPESIRVRDQLAAIDQQIRDEAQRVVNSLKAQASAAEAQVASLHSTMRELEARRAQHTRTSAQGEMLERDAASKRALYDKMSQLSLESTQTAKNSIAQAEIVDRATPPGGPTSPNRPLLYALSSMVAVATGFLVILVLEMAQGGLRTIAEIEELGLPVLASVPLEGPRRRWFHRRRKTSPADGIGAEGATMYSEAIRNLRASLVGIGQPDVPRVIAFTSALPDEGKTTTALSFARMLAVNGTRTLLIDCDLRNAELRGMLGLARTAGLVEVLRGETSLVSAVRADSIGGLDVLPIASSLFTSEDLFGDGAMQRLLVEARARYQTIVLDLPPVLGVADSRTLAVLADAVSFVVRWGSTAPRAVVHALSLLQSDNVDIAGVVYAMVDPTSEAVGGIYYSRGYRKYYKVA